MSKFFDKPSATRRLGLQVEDQTFWVSEQILALHSPVFEAVFYGQFRESRRKTIFLPGKKASDILEVLLCIFPTPKMKRVSESNVDILLPLADEYQMEDLKMKCEACLRRRVRSINNKKKELLSILCTASKYALTPLVTECAKKCVTICSTKDILPYLPRLTAKDIACIFMYRANELENEKSKHEVISCRAYYSRTCYKCDRDAHSFCNHCQIYFCRRCMGENGCAGNPKASVDKAVEQVMKKKKN